MAHLIITINDAEFANASLPATVTVHFPEATPTQVVPGQPEQYFLRSAFAEKIFNLIEEEVGLHSLWSKTKFQASFKELYEPEHILLTSKEKEVLQLLRRGYSYKMIAEELQKSIQTIKVQIKSIYKKLKVSSNTQAVIKSLDENLL